MLALFVSEEAVPASLEIVPHLVSNDVVYPLSLTPMDDQVGR